MKTSTPIKCPYKAERMCNCKLNMSKTCGIKKDFNKCEYLIFSAYNGATIKKNK